LSVGSSSYMAVAKEVMARLETSASTVSIETLDPKLAAEAASP
jgi:hypothetical protein